MQPIKTFIENDSGAVTVDWVVLTAAIVGLGFTVLIPIAYGTESATDKVGDRIADIEVGYLNQ